MKKLLILLFSILISFNSYGEVELDFSSDTFCDQSPKAQVRDGLFYLPNQEKPYSGENLCVYLSNGQYYSRGEIKNGIREGKWEYWHENGQKKEERNYINGWERGEGGSVIFRYGNGQKWMEFNYKDGNYKDGKLDGKDAGWHENGQKMYEGIYKDGKKDGKWIGWDKNGQINSEGNFEDGTGKETYWHENGQKSSESNYIDGKLHGKQTRWYKNGQKSNETNTKDGKLHGKWTLWYIGGDKGSQANYEDGVCISGDCPDD